MSILSIRPCKRCKKRLVKNPLKTGDYDEEGTLLSFCPDCGEGFPLLNSGVYITISHRKLKILSSRTAMVHNLSFSEMDNLAGSLRGVKKSTALRKFRNEINKKYQIELSPEIFSGI